MIEFRLEMDQIPSGTAQMKRTNRKTGAFFEADSVKRARTLYTSLLIPHRPKDPAHGAIQIEVIFEYAIKDKKKRGHWKTGRPDCDNLVKLFLDCMSSVGFWNDDAQIVILTVCKRYSVSDHANILVSMKER